MKFQRVNRQDTACIHGEQNSKGEPRENHEKRLQNEEKLLKRHKRRLNKLTFISRHLILEANTEACFLLKLNYINIINMENDLSFSVLQNG